MSEQEIPAELIETARALCNKLARTLWHRTGDPVRTVAAALLAERRAERERCAKIAERASGTVAAWIRGASE